MTCETDQSAKSGVDAYRAVRRLERFLNIDTNAPREDQGAALSFDELAEMASRRANPQVVDPDETVVASTTFRFENGKLTEERTTHFPRELKP